MSKFMGSRDISFCFSS
uniref:Uncharacterized protein n=1 Tax=Arundo donax TaxID=35708 RepID=A0A0A8YHK7_ARUDO